MDDAHDELIKNKTTNDDEVVRRTYYEEYQRNYSKRYKKKVLQSVYNVMIGYDHEFIDDYDSVPNNLTPTMLKNVKEMYTPLQDDLYGVNEHDIISHIKHLVLCSPNEDFGRTNEQLGTSFRSTFQGFECSIWSTPV